MHGNTQLSALIFPDHFTVLAYHVSLFCVLFKCCCINLLHSVSHICHTPPYMSRGFSARQLPYIWELMSRSVTVKSWEIAKDPKLWPQHSCLGEGALHVQIFIRTATTYIEKIARRLPFSARYRSAVIHCHYSDGAVLAPLPCIVAVLGLCFVAKDWNCIAFISVVVINGLPFVWVKHY